MNRRRTSSIRVREQDETLRLVLGAVMMGLAGSLIILATPSSRHPVVAAPPQPSFVAQQPPASAGRGAAPVLSAGSPSARIGEGPAYDDLRRRNLLVPVEGIKRESLIDSFKDKRDLIRQHEAMDIMAPRGTPVLAAESGTIEKFFTSLRGGKTIY